MKKIFPIYLITIICIFALVNSSNAAGLERSGRWLEYDGSPIWLVGYDLQQLFTDASYSETQVKAKIDTLAAYGTTCFRIWLNTWFLNYDDYYPYTYSGGKFNLDSFNSAYWTRVKNLISYAKTKGIIVEVVVFSEYPRVDTNMNYWSNRKVFWRSAENSNGVFSEVNGDLYPEFFTINYTQSGKNLTTYQIGLANKAIDELKPIGNVFFQVHNEFPAVFSGTGQYVDQVHGWQEYMADHFHSTKGAITSVHAHEGSSMQIYGLDYWKNRASVDILNFHPYSSTNNNNIDAIGSMFGSLSTYGKVLMFDESHAFENSAYTDTVTREMWAAFTNGIYYLAYTGDNFIIGDAGWTARADRILALKKISDLGDWSNAVRNPSLVKSGPGGYWQGIANSGNFYVYYFTGAKTTSAVSMVLPAGSYTYKWFDTRSWNSNGIANGSITSSGVSVSIAAPPTGGWESNTGVVLVLSRQTTAVYCGDGTCNGSETCSSCPADCGSCQNPVDLPGWTFCANEGGQCNFTGTKEVQYGANGQYFSGIYSNGVLCANSVFNDPIVGAGKYCYYRDVTNPNCVGPVLFYSDINYSGNSSGLDIGSHNQTALSACGIQNDDVSSLKVPPGYRVLLYENYDFAGAYLVKTGDDASLIDDGWNDRASSIKIEAISAKPGDLNADNKVDVTDLGIFLANWGMTTKPASDINQDGKVDVTDLGILLGNWG